MDPKFPEIIYIMGTGRSGTTLLEILLSNNPGISGAGELTHIFRDGALDNIHCSCGKTAWECRRWGGVFHHIGLDESSSSRYRALLNRIDWHWGFFKQALGLFNGRERKQYEGIHSELFAAIAGLAGESRVVDSSKYAARAIALYRAYPEKVKVICLTRSPAGLIKAFKKVDAEEQKPKKLISIVLYYWCVILCCRIVTNIVGEQNCVVVTFEQLMKQTDDVLGKIENLIGVSLKGAKRKIAKNEYLQTGHIVTGNRLRKKGKIKFKPKISNNNANSKVEYLAEKTMLLFGKALGFHY